MKQFLVFMELIFIATFLIAVAVTPAYVIAITVSTSGVTNPIILSISFIIVAVALMGGLITLASIYGKKDKEEE